MWKGWCSLRIFKRSEVLTWKFSAWFYIHGGVKWGSDFYGYFMFCKIITNLWIFPLHTGAVCTLGALAYGLFSFVRGDQKMQQYMMRTRVAAQGGTLVAVVAGVFYMLYQERQAKGGKTWKWCTVTCKRGQRYKCICAQHNLHNEQ